MYSPTVCRKKFAAVWCFDIRGTQTMELNSWAQGYSQFEEIYMFPFSVMGGIFGTMERCCVLREVPLPPPSASVLRHLFCGVRPLLRRLWPTYAVWLVQRHTQATPQGMGHTHNCGWIPHEIQGSIGVIELA